MVKKLSADNKPRKFKVSNISKTVGVDSGMLRSIDSFVDKVVKGSALESKSGEETRRSHIELFFHFQ